MMLPALALFAAVVPRAGDPVCHPLADPKHLPALDVVMDSAGLVGRLQAIDATAGPGVTVSILMAKSPSGIVFAGAAAQGEQVLTAVLASLRPASKATPQAFRVNVQLGTVPVIALERSVLCNPQTVEMEPNAQTTDEG